MSQTNRCDICGVVEDHMSTIWKWGEFKFAMKDRKEFCPVCSAKIEAFIKQAANEVNR